MELLERSQVPHEHQWNVADLFPSIEIWKETLAKAKQGHKPRWPEIAAYKGRLSEGPKVLAEMLSKYFNIDESLSRLYTYAHLRHDEDVALEGPKQAYIEISGLLHEFREETSWIEPELLNLKEEMFKAPELADYTIYLKKILRFKPHTLSASEEALLASAGQAMETAERSFGAFNNADLQFPKIKNGKGEEVELTHGKYLTYMRSQDRKLRENAFKTLHTSFQRFENTLCELINGEVQKHIFFARARKFPTSLDAALFPHQIDRSVYLNLIKTTKKRLSVLHNYMKLRKKVLGYAELHPWDLHVSLVNSVDMSMEYDKAEKLVIEAVEPLGESYKKTLHKGLTEQKWVDRFENRRKRSGAYSSGCYGKMPYILMNYHGQFHDVLTLSHEAGHSMHSFLSWQTQKYPDASYPIFVAEVASTLNEELLIRHLIKKKPSKETLAFLINQKLEDIRNTFFRQTMFAEFELTIHELAESGVPLTPTLLKAEYRKLNEAYFGPDVVLDHEIDIEWARIPHFYYNFYVYQYATGISAAHTLADLVEKEGPARYLKFLSSGGSAYPLDLLAMAGVDMKIPDAINAQIDAFERLTKDLSIALNI